MSNHGSSVAKDVPGGQVAPIAELQALLERVVAATGPDRELDGELFCLLTWTRDNTDPDLMRLVESGEWAAALGAVHHGWREMPSWVPAYTGSIDAAQDIMEGALPGWSWGIADATKPTCRAILYAPTPWGYRARFAAAAKKPALALTAASLVALIEQAASPAERHARPRDEPNV